MDQVGTAKDKVVELAVGEGNKKTSPPKSRQVQAQYWCSGVFHYDLGLLDKEFRPFVKKFIAGAEVCPSTGTKHYQCYWDFGKRIRPIEKFRHLNIKWFKCKGNEWQNEKYCSKDGDFLKIGMFESDFKIRLEHLRENQIEIVNDICIPVDPRFNRTIKWYWEDQGDWGKTITYTYLIDNKNTCMTGGTQNDMLCAVKAFIDENGYPDIIVVNLPKDSNMISYRGLEQLADGLMFSGKYESRSVRFPRCQIAVFANIPPDESKMGAGRFIVHELVGQPYGCLSARERDPLEAATLLEDRSAGATAGVRRTAVAPVEASSPTRLSVAAFFTE